jgi:hypothetical protein
MAPNSKSQSEMLLAKYFDKMLCSGGIGVLTITINSPRAIAPDKRAFTEMDLSRIRKERNVEML